MSRYLLTSCLSLLFLGAACDDEGAGADADASPDVFDATVDTADASDETGDAGADADVTLDVSDAAPDATGDWTMATLCQALSGRICAGLSGCDCRFDVRAYDETGCVDARTAACEATFGARIEPDIAAGRVRIDDTTVSACLDGIDALAADCDLAHAGESPLPPACDRMVLATAGLDEDCEIAGLALCADGTGVCAPGEGSSTCTALPGDGEACLGPLCAAGLVCHAGEAVPTCGPPAAADEDCIQDGACEPGLVCLPGGACGVPGEDGADCADNPDCAKGFACSDGSCAEAPALGDECRSPSVCGAGASCGRAPETRTCEEPHAENEGCEPGSCAVGLACDSFTRACVHLPGENEPCLDGAICAPELTCAFSSQTCIALPGDGQPCYAEGSAFCAPGFGCRESDQTCRPASIATEGEPCLLNPPDYVCAEGLGCDFGAEGSICTELGGEGDPCNSDRTCGTGFYCEFSTLTCTTRLADGSACEDGNECLMGSECQIRAGEPSCAPIPGEGEPCFTDCSVGLTCQGPGGQCVPELCVLP